MKEQKIVITLAAARVNAGLNQSELAEKMHVTRQTIVNWEKGKVIPGIPELNMMSKIFNIPLKNIVLPNNSTKSKLLKEKN